MICNVFSSFVSEPEALRHPEPRTPRFDLSFLINSPINRALGLPIFVPVPLPAQGPLSSARHSYLIVTILGILAVVAFAATAQVGTAAPSRSTPTLQYHRLRSLPGIIGTSSVVSSLPILLLSLARTSKTTLPFTQDRIFGNNHVQSLLRLFSIWTVAD